MVRCSQKMGNSKGISKGEGGFPVRWKQVKWYVLAIVFTLQFVFACAYDFLYCHNPWLIQLGLTNTRDLWKVTLTITLFTAGCSVLTWLFIAALWGYEGKETIQVRMVQEGIYEIEKEG